MIGIAWKGPVLIGCLAAVCLVATDARAQHRDPLAEFRNLMVDQEIVAAGVDDPRVVEAMRTTPRHEFVSVSQRRYAYLDMALPIGESQTISPPFVVALMTESLDPQPTDKVLEIGTGSGYQAAVLSGLVREVYTIEIVRSLGLRAERTLKRLRYDNVHVKVGDGFQGWPEHAPFDKIIVTCSPERVPPALVAQLKEGGRIVIPVGERYDQTLCLLKKVNGKMVSEALRPTLFVPMTGQAEDNRQVKPDPANPAIHNGDFELIAGDPPRASGWHYQRLLELVADGSAPSGKTYAKFNNRQPGRGCRALQGLAVDGREVRALQVVMQVRGRNIAPGQNAGHLPVLGVTFYDANRAVVGHGIVGPFRGTFDWQTETGTIEVPRQAREGIVRIGLLGAVGEIAFDAIELKGVKR
ncbi:MAG: protein-L-isoaspartate(D-aspartate) O-methyltransferase [Pirellulales bacterium]|nr:protein-L-isoaspartate(D-aspartate) O-methyltransferase [Pirellulales bacterium]